MSQDFDVVAAVVTHAQYNPTEGIPIVNTSYGFALSASNLVRTLSANNPHGYGSIGGLLYVPDLSSSSSCDNSTKALIPANVSALANIPPGDYPLIGLAPWTQTPCVEAYLSAMASAGVQGGIFFHPGNDSEQPPPVSDPSWSLEDGGQWKSDNPYPVYAIPGMLGAFLLEELALYSGNLSQVPYGPELAKIYSSSDLIRLAGRLDVDASSGIPSLWVFLIIVLAILLVVVFITSVVMHVIQRKQRRQFQRRVANGEVDLEALGIKRLTVPQDILDHMPQYTYSTAEINEKGAIEQEKSFQPDENEPVVSGRPLRKAIFNQPTCPICLDDFTHGDTIVRELPCNHIYHPECIDPFLRENSSLCPMCKKSVLPAGYCPVQVTNLMVRRERLLRRTGRRSTPENGRLAAPVAALNRRVRRLTVDHQGQQVEAPIVDLVASELRTLPRRSHTNIEDEMPAEVRLQGTSARRAWRREQLARQQARDYSHQAEEARVTDVSRPLWRRVVGRVIPRLD
ncbi:hypothetical protein LTR10_014875 [Elasticomyces elasticus]|uniref:RING-type domain-containing protein n=1 Tax=Exophiala sideris TaxID=1016849 RepID=A0ABR0JGC0_9EURO|nr:hypothetical protein LTR10_014875 [Elasticomyces elasticus]KAK5025719.1 hypothetical protein LTS07_007923 [Exophiala sideris]KAK5033072.1 hypothetical protein LTR13_007037 [Exophiala sideris]KAK5063557.1 hypothetical protein LTR69_004263 [Exophiala sideris]KAK5180610.1 hypothetical protein LTR44_006924 [Eurotiomycetes sp. CCFEE 6388]